MSIPTRRGLSLFAVATLCLAASCVEEEASPSLGDPSEALPRQQYRIQLPDGRLAVVTGVRRGDQLVVGGDMIFPLNGGAGAGPRAASVQYAQLWPTRRIPYVFAGAVDPPTRQ